MGIIERLFGKMIFGKVNFDGLSRFKGVDFLNGS
jgi:hypothetical protein